MDKKTVLLMGKNSEIGIGILNTINTDYNVISFGKTDIDLYSDTTIQYDISPNIIVYCAGINEIKSFNDITEEDILKHMNINCIGLFKLVKKFKDSLTNGKIVVISSIYGHFSRKNRLMYSTSKHALNGLVKSLAIELAEDNILVNSISPGFVDTQLTRKNNSDEKIKQLCNNVPLKRLMIPSEIGQLVKFLISNNNTFITGQDIVIDGGYSIGGFEV